MKLVFFSDLNVNGKVPKVTYHRAEYAWMTALDAPHYNIKTFPTNWYEYITSADKFDLGVVVMAEDTLDVDLKVLKGFCNKIVTMQVKEINNVR